MKVAALLYDELILDQGQWMGRSGSGGATEMYDPNPSEQPVAWQTAGARRREMNSEWYMALRPSGQATGGVTLRSPTSLSWRASYDPIRQELPRAYDWIEFGAFGLHPRDKTIASRMAREALADGLLKDTFGDDFTRDLVAKNATTSIVLASRMEAAVSLDKTHSLIAAARLAHGDARPVFGGRSLVAVIPDVRDLPWEDVDAARRLRGLPRLRAVLADIEREAVARGGALDEDLLRAFQEEYARARAEIESVAGSFVTSAAIGGAVSILALPITGPLGIAAGVAVGAGIDAGRTWRRNRQRRDSWTTAADQLMAAASQAQAERDPSATAELRRVHP